jgi:hypothetical protein
MDLISNIASPDWFKIFGDLLLTRDDLGQKTYLSFLTVFYYKFQQEDNLMVRKKDNDLNIQIIGNPEAEKWTGIILKTNSTLSPMTPEKAASPAGVKVLLVETVIIKIFERKKI